MEFGTLVLLNDNSAAGLRGLQDGPVVVTGGRELSSGLSFSEAMEAFLEDPAPLSDSSSKEVLAAMVTEREAVEGDEADLDPDETKDEPEDESSSSSEDGSSEDGPKPRGKKPKKKSKKKSEGKSSDSSRVLLQDLVTDVTTGVVPGESGAPLLGSLVVDQQAAERDENEIEDVPDVLGDDDIVVGEDDGFVVLGLDMYAQQEVL